MDLILQNNVTVLNLELIAFQQNDIILLAQPDLVLELNDNVPNGGSQNLQQVTDVGNTTTDDIEITDEDSGLILRLGSRRARITLTDDGFGNLQLTITEL